MTNPKMNVNLVVGDLTTFSGDVIVNAANPPMLGGGGVDGAIHRAAGPRLRIACRQVWVESGVRCPTGQVRPTPAYELDAKWVFHTVGPIFELQRAGEFRPGESPSQSKSLLRDCFRKAIIMAVAMGLKSIAIPAISTGVYGCPHDICADVALRWCFQQRNLPINVTFYIYPAEPAYGIWTRAYRQIFGLDPVSSE